MAADLHIHVRTPELTDDVMRMFFSSTIGDGKWCIPFPEDSDSEESKSVMDKWWETKMKLEDQEKEWEKTHDMDLHVLFSHSPNIWIGEVSWLKAGLLEDGDRYIPATIDEVFGITDGAIIDDNLIGDIKKAFDLPNATNYNLANVDDVVNFLESHKGMEVFTISW